MALTRFNYQLGQYETCTDETLVPASPVLNTWYNFEIGDWKHAISDVVLKQGGLAIPTSAYELAIDTKYTAREVGESDKTIYAKWRIVDATYDEIATTVSGNNFGTYIDNAKLDARLDALEAFDAALDAGEVPYDNSSSGLIADDVQAAIDEVDGTVDDLEALTPTKTGEVLALSSSFSEATKTLFFRIKNPSIAATTGQYAIVQIILSGNTGGTVNVYLNGVVSGSETGSTNWAILNATGDNFTAYLILPFGQYGLYIDNADEESLTVTAKYKVVDTKIAYA